MELFVFVRMGGKHIVVELLSEGGADVLSIRMAHFDAGKAQCFLDGDKQRLWAIIEASFGTFEPFNKIVRDIFADQLGTTAMKKAAQVRPGPPPSRNRATMRSAWAPVRL